LKYNISEKISERKAAINSNLSVVVNFLNITLLILKFSIIWLCNKKVWFLFRRSIFSTLSNHVIERVIYLLYV
jgi:hypothetical protein